MADINHWYCKVLLATDVTSQLALHELLHCLGWHRHDRDPSSVMAEKAGPKVLPDHLEYVLRLMGLDDGGAQ